MPHQLITSDEAKPAKSQHTKPCSDCPFARTSLRGWLGGFSVEEWMRDARSDAILDCHVHKGAQCAGGAIFRAHICKLPRDSDALKLPRNEKLVFKNPAEFEEHHG